MVAAWRPDGRQIAVGGLDGSVALVDPHTGDVRKVPSTGTNAVAFVAYRPDGRELWVTDFNRHDAIITGLDGARPTVSRTKRLDGANQVVFTADGRSLVALRPGEIQVYDAATLIPRAAPIAVPAAGYSYAMSLNADGRYAAINDLSNHMRLVDLDAGRPIGPPLPIGALSGSLFTRDGKALLTNAPNRAARALEHRPTALAQGSLRARRPQPHASRMAPLPSERREAPGDLSGQPAAVTAPDGCACGCRNLVRRA